MTVLIDEISYNLDFNTLTASVCMSENKYAGVIRIPTSIVYEDVTYCVTSIAEFAFMCSPNLSSVVLPIGITKIGASAFYYCSSLISISIPISVTYIGNNAFCKCSSLSSVSIPISVTYIGDGAFMGCSSLTSVSLPMSITHIGDSVFCDCSALVSVSLPISVMSIGDSAFSGCKDMTNIVIPYGVTHIGDNAFAKCSTLSDVVIPDGVISLGHNVFENCVGLTTMIIPLNIKSIGWHILEGCDNLTAIMWNAKNCKVLEKKRVYPASNYMNPNGRLLCGPSPVLSCNSVVSIVFGNEVESIPTYLCARMEKLYSVTIPDSVREVGNSAFRGCIGLKSIYIPNSVAKIGEYAFRDCASLMEISFPTEITNVGDSAFDNTPWLNQYNEIVYVGNTLYKYQGSMPQGMNCIIKEGTKCILNFAFQDCKNLSSICIPSSVSHIGQYTFIGCVNLSSIIVETGNEIYDSRDSCNAIIETATNTLIVGGKYTVIPSTVTKIGSEAFVGRKGLTSLHIPRSVISIESGAFSGCEDLYSIVVEAENEVYDSRDNCNAIIETATDTLVTGCITTTIPKNILRIGDSAFYGCAKIISLTIPPSVKYISGFAFFGCTDLQCIRVMKGNGNFARETYDNSYNRANDYDIVSDSGDLIYVYEENCYRDIEFWFDDEFYNKLLSIQDKVVEYTPALIDGVLYELDSDFTAIVCSNQNKNNGHLNIPNRIRYEDNVYVINRIASKAFADFNNLMYVTLPISIREMGENVFVGCNNLQNIYVPQGMVDYFCQIGLEQWRHLIVEQVIPLNECNEQNEDYDCIWNETRHYDVYGGYNGYDDETIDAAFEGDPEATWNCD